jgi:hypothetical protein
MGQMVRESNPSGGKILISIFFDGKWDDKEFWTSLTFLKLYTPYKHPFKMPAVITISLTGQLTLPCESYFQYKGKLI